MPVLSFFSATSPPPFDERHKELASKLTRHTHDIVVKAFGGEHPLAHLLRRLVCVPDEDRYDLIATILDASIDRFKSFHGSSRIVERVNIHHFLLLDYMGRTGGNTKPVVSEMDFTSLEAIDVGYLSRLSARLICKGEFEQADRRLALTHPWLEEPLNQRDPCWPDLQMCYYHLMAHGRFSSGKWQEGDIWLKKVQQHSAEYFPNM